MKDKKTSPKQTRKAFYTPTFCEICGEPFKASRRHAFLCSARCRKRFSRLGPLMQAAIRRVVCRKYSWYLKRS